MSNDTIKDHSGSLHIGDCILPKLLQNHLDLRRIVDEVKRMSAVESIL